MMSPGLAAIVYGLAETSLAGGLADVRALAPLLAGVALVTAFVLHARRSPRPLIDVRLLNRRPFAAAFATVLLLGVGLFGSMFLLPLYYQGARGLSALDAGLLMAPQGIGAALVMPFAGRATDGSAPAA